MMISYIGYLSLQSYRFILGIDIINSHVQHSLFLCENVDSKKKKKKLLNNL